jgi:hypothetical protein
MSRSVQGSPAERRCAAARYLHQSAVFALSPLTGWQLLIPEGADPTSQAESVAYVREEVRAVWRVWDRRRGRLAHRQG